LSAFIGDLFSKKESEDKAMKPRKLGAIFVLCVGLSCVSSTLSLAQVRLPPIPTTPPVQFRYTIPNQPLDQVFGRVPDLQGAAERKLYLNLSAPGGSAAGDAETAFRIIVTAGISTGNPLEH
jgi:hypothetical protein